MPEINVVAGSASTFASGAGGELRLSPVVHYALNLSETEPGEPKRMCYLPVPCDDAPSNIARFYEACHNDGVIGSHLQPPDVSREEVEDCVTKQNLIWPGGGPAKEILKVWQDTDSDLYKLLLMAAEAGVPVGGMSAGSIFWSAGGTTDSDGSILKPIINADGLLPFSTSVHYDSEPQRRPLFHELIAAGVLPEGYATDDGVALHFVGNSLWRAVTQIAGQQAYHVFEQDGEVVERAITPMLLAANGSLAIQNSACAQL